MLPIAPWLSAMRTESTLPTRASKPSRLVPGVAGFRRSVGHGLIAVGHWFAGAEATRAVSVGR